MVWRKRWNETFKAGVSKIIDDGQHNRIMFYNLSILPNAEMGDPAYQRQFGMVTVPQQIIAMHSAVNEVDEVAEYYDTVVATASMPAADWVKAKMFWWMSEMLYFDRIAQISFVLLRGIYQVAYHELVEACLQANSATHPVLGFIQNEFKAKATAIQQGDIEYLADQDWLQVWWPAHQHVLIKLQEGGLIDALFAELEQVVAELLRTKCIDHDPLLVHEGIEFNKAMYRLPGLSTDLKLNLSHNILEFYQAVLLGQPAPLENHLVYRYNINRRWFQSPDLDDWCEHLIESHNRKSLHLYPAVRVAA